MLAVDMQTLKLPSPLLSTSLADVTYAAQCVSNAGITVEGLEGWSCDLWNREPANACDDTTSAQLLRAAGRAVQPFSIYSPDHFMLKHYLQTETALIRWASPVLQELHIKYYDHLMSKPSLLLWQAWQCCKNLQHVYYNCYARNHADFSFTADILEQVQLAAEQFVAINQRSLKLAFKCWCGDRPPKDMLKKEIQEKMHRHVGLWECSWGTDCNCLTVVLGPEVRLTEKST